MTALAKEMAASRQFHPVAETDHEHIAMTGNTVEQLANLLLSEDQENLDLPKQSPQTLEASVAYIAVQSIIPTNLSGISMYKIIEVRRKYSEELRAFQNHFHSLVSDASWLGDVTNKEALELHLNKLCDESILRELNKLKNGLKSWGIDTTTGAVVTQIALPAAITGGIIEHITLNPTLAGIGAVAFAPVPILLKARASRQQLLATSPAAYLFHLEEELSPSTLLSRLTRKARQITYGV